MNRPAIRLATLLLGVTLLAACGDNGDGDPSPTAPSGAGSTPEATDSSAAGLDAADFQALVDNPIFPLSSGGTAVYEGEETDPDTGEVITLRVESTVLPETDVIAGIEVTVVEVKDYENGELVESTLDYYAQHVDGTVYYLGERVDDYEGGEVVGHTGQWLAGEGENLPGVFMPAAPAAGDEFEQERAPGIAEDRSKVIAVDLEVTTPAGAFAGCIQTEDYDPIGDVTESKYYCPAVGLVREESEDLRLELVSR